MKTIRTSSPDEAVLVWLQAELKSKRFQNDLQKSLDKYRLDVKIITKPSMNSTATENTKQNAATCLLKATSPARDRQSANFLPSPRRGG